MTESRTTDPFSAWREMIDQQTEAWSQLMAETMGTEAFAAALGRQMESYLGSQGQAQRRFLDVMEQYLKSLNLPSRTELSRVAAQVGAVEAKVDELDQRMDEVVALLGEIRDGVERSARRDDPAQALAEIRTVLGTLESRTAALADQVSGLSTEQGGGESPQRGRRRGRQDQPADEATSSGA